MTQSRTIRWLAPLLCLIGGLALVAAHALLKPRIEAAKQHAAQAIYREVLNLRGDDDAQFYTIALPADTQALWLSSPAHAIVAQRNHSLIGIALPATSHTGYGGDIELLIGIDVTGKIMRVRALAHNETRELGDAIDANKSRWIDQFEGRSLDANDVEAWHLQREGGRFDGITGATITARAVIAAVHGGLDYFAAHRAELLKGERNDGKQ